MKVKTFITCIIILIASETKAQYQSVFGSHSTNWEFACYNLDQASVADLSVRGDTILANGYSYKQVLGYMLFREDTLTGRVWYKKLGRYCANIPDTAELLVMDMSLSLGDTFISRYTYWGDVDSFLIADSIYYQNGLKHIRFKKSATFTTIEAIEFIEGVGPNESLFWMANDCSGCLAPYLLCSYKDSIQTGYVNTRYNGDCNPVFAGIHNISDNSLTVSPNPSKDHLQFSYSIQDADLTITDLTGRICSVTHTDREIDISSLPVGVYSVRLQSRDAAIVRRFVKE